MAFRLKIQCSMTGKLVQIAHNPVVAKLINVDDDVRTEVSAMLSYKVEGHEHMDAFKSGSWDGRSTMFTYATDTFPAGFVGPVEKRLRSKGYRVQRVTRPLPEPLGPEMPVVDSFGFDPRYDYQMGTVEALLKRGAMIARVATGGGKSRIAKLCHARIGRPTLFLTTRKVLMYQMKTSFEASGWKCGVMGDGEWSPDGHLNVAMVQTLQARLQEPDEYDKSPEAMRQRRVRARTIELLEQVEFVIGEEAHEAGAAGYSDVLRHCKKAAYRLALTGTPFMRDDAEANMRLMAAFGTIGIEVSEELLISRGILATPKFKIVNSPKAKGLRNGTAWQRAVELGISQNTGRNQIIVDEAVRARQYGLTSMILVQRKKHGAELQKMLKEAGLRVKFIYGDSDQEAREKALKALGDGTLDVLIGTTILDVGVDVPAVGLIVLAGGGKAEVALRQRIGRGLRAKKNGPNFCFVLDFEDEHNKHLRKHALSRQAVIKRTPGFVENIIPKGQDFDYEGLGYQIVG